MLGLTGCRSAQQIQPHSPEPASNDTLFGSTVQMLPGKSYPQARERMNRVFGRLPIVRYYYPGAPAPWAALSADVGDRPVVVSFKIPPSAVLSGAYDDRMRAWFASAPTTTPAFWSYQPEPEDDIANGDFSAVQFRAAWQHLSEIATSVASPSLQATLVLMCYTLDPSSGRHWQDYYPGAAFVDIVGWDCYNRSASQGRYAGPNTIFSPVVRLSQQLHKPFAIAETGSLLVDQDSGSKRAEWLLETARYLSANGAVFVTYFDSTVGGDYRLQDPASIQAWRAVISW